MDGNTSAPEPVVRPKLAHFIWSRNLDWREAGKQLGMSGEGVRAICLPFGDPKRRIPRPRTMKRIGEWTQGEVGPADFYPPNFGTSEAPSSESRSPQ